MDAPAPAGENLSGHCGKVYGGVDDSKFGEPMPWIGMYIALASLVPLVCICLDLFHSYRLKKLWVAAKWYPLNAATITFLGVATKITADITGSMPGLCEQLAKLSGAVLVCITMSRAASSLGKMDAGETLSNLIALGILVITLFVDMWIQIHSGVVTDFVAWYAACSIVMLHLFFVVVCHTISTKALMKPLKENYSSKHKAILDKTFPSYWLSKLPMKNLREYIAKYWLMPVSSSFENPLLNIMPVVSASTSAILGLAFVVTAVKTGVFQRIHEGCCWSSDYKWSAVLIFVFQLAAVAAGTVVCFLRLASLFRLPSIDDYFLGGIIRDRHAVRSLTKVSGLPIPYFIKVMEPTARFPVTIIFRIVIAVTHVFLVLFISGFFWLGLLQYYVLGLPMVGIRAAYRSLVGRQKTDQNEVAYRSIVGDKYEVPYRSTNVTEPRPCDYVLYRTYDFGRIALKGQSAKATHLLAFLRENFVPSERFRGMVPILDERSDETEGPPNNWSSTLTSLAMVVRAVTPDNSEIASLMEVFDKGIEYAFFLDRSFCTEGTYTVASVAKNFWDDFYVFRFRVSLLMEFEKVAALQSCKKIVEHIKKTTKHIVDIHPELYGKESPWQWQSVVIYASCFFKTTSSIITNIDPPDDMPSDRNAAPHLRLRKALCDTLVACLLNLPTAIIKHCSSGEFGAREGKVREAIILLDEVQEILDWLESRRDEIPPDCYPSNGIEFIHNWRHQGV